MTKTLLTIEVVSIVLMLVGILGQRFQILPFKLAFGGFALATLAVAVVAIISAVMLLLSLGLIQLDKRAPLVVCFALGFLPLLAIIFIVGKGFSVPKIHDISTNLEDNIAFEKAGALRQAGENSLDFPSERVSRLHQEFYSTIAPIVVAGAPEDVFGQAKRAALALGWGIHHSNPDLLTFEATETTAVFGFVDDVVVRITPTGEQSVVDIRSVSRVGVSDLGANAKRIQRFQKEMTKSEI